MGKPLHVDVQVKVDGKGQDMLNEDGLGLQEVHQSLAADNRSATRLLKDKLRNKNRGKRFEVGGAKAHHTALESKGGDLGAKFCHCAEGFSKSCLADPQSELESPRGTWVYLLHRDAPKVLQASQACKSSHRKRKQGKRGGARNPKRWQSAQSRK